MDRFGGHERVGLLSPDTSEITPLVFSATGKVRQVTLPWSVMGAETNFASACLGLGLVQAPRYRVTSELATGAMVEVLADFPPTPLPVHVRYSHTCQPSPRLRVFIDWIAEQFRKRFSPAG
jgi:DNA-binding transcriptional LysR family regulator